MYKCHNSIFKGKSTELSDEAKAETKLLSDKLEIKKEIDQMTPEEIQKLKQQLRYYKWKDDVVLILRRAERFGDVEQSGYLRTSRRSYFMP